MNHNLTEWHTTNRIQTLKPHYLTDNILLAIAAFPRLAKTRWSLEKWGWLAGQPELAANTPIKLATKERNYAAVAIIAGLYPSAIADLSSQQKQKFPGIEELRDAMEGTANFEELLPKLGAWPTANEKCDSSWLFSTIGIEKPEFPEKPTTQPWAANMGEKIVTTLAGHRFTATSHLLLRRDKRHPRLIALKINDQAAAINLSQTMASEVNQAKGLFQQCGVAVVTVNIPESREPAIKDSPDQKAALQLLLAETLIQNMTRHPTAAQPDSASDLLSVIQPKDLTDPARRLIHAWAKFHEANSLWRPRNDFENTPPQPITRYLKNCFPDYQPEPETLARSL